jgi:hypothetical protein
VPKKAETVQLLPVPSTEEKAQLRTTLAAIRAAMPVEQVQCLERYQGVLLGYSHLIEVYLEPQRFVDTKGLAADKAAERIVAAQKVALRTLLPTKGDTLAGAIKVLTEAVRRIILLQRTVAGLDKVASAALRPGDPNNPFGDEDGGKGQIINLDAMDPADRQAVQDAMELLNRHRHKQQDAPKPPRPAPIDDLRGPEGVVVREPEDEEVPSR